MVNFWIDLPLTGIWGYENDFEQIMYGSEHTCLAETIVAPTYCTILMVDKWWIVDISIT